MRLRMTRLQRGAFLGIAVTALLAALIDCGGDTDSPTQKSNGITRITVAAAATELDAPVDATPDPLGTVIYFIASLGGKKGVFKVPFGGGVVSQLYLGEPLVNPRGISTSSDGKTLYVADTGFGTSGKGAILSLPSSGDTPVVVSGSDGLAPTALDLIEDGAGDDIYFTGADANGVPGVYRLAAKGGNVTTLAQGAPLMKPDGIAVATDLTVYVSDSQAGLDQPGELFVIKTGKPAKLGPEFKPGSPAGLAITLDDGKVLASSIDADTGTSQVTIVQTKDGTSGVFNDVIKTNKVSGGVHRARFKELYAWAGFNKVYGIKIKTIQADSSTPGGIGG